MENKYRYAQFDPRPTGMEANEAVFAAAEKVYGIEVTVPTLAARCVVNIDHHGANTTAETPSAIEQALTTCELPEAGSVLATVRADSDSVGAMAVLAARLEGKGVNTSLVQAIGLVDRKGPQAGVEEFKPLTVAIARKAADFKIPLPERVAWIQDVLTSDDLHEEEVAALNAERDREFAAAKAASEVTVAADGRIAVVTSSHRFATNLGYEMADIVVAYNPKMPVDFKDPTKGVYMKYTLCVRDSHVPFDMKGAVSALNALETARREDGLRWGGQATIAGSPQGVSSKLTLVEVVAIATYYLK